MLLHVPCEHSCHDAFAAVFIGTHLRIGEGAYKLLGRGRKEREQLGCR